MRVREIAGEVQITLSIPEASALVTDLANCEDASSSTERLVSDLDDILDPSLDEDDNWDDDDEDDWDDTEADDEEIVS